MFIDDPNFDAIITRPVFHDIVHLKCMFSQKGNICHRCHGCLMPGVHNLWLHAEGHQWFFCRPWLFRNTYLKLFANSMTDNFKCFKTLSSNIPRHINPHIAPYLLMPLALRCRGAWGASCIDLSRRNLQDVTKMEFGAWGHQTRCDDLFLTFLQAALCWL